MKLEKLIVLKVAKSLKMKARKANGNKQASLVAITKYLQNKIPSLSKH